jgi:Ca-activated chloride channel homolog
LVPVHVTHASGDPVTGRTLDRYIYEGDMEQTITSFSSEDAPLSIGILFGASGSKRYKMDKACEAAANFFRTANTED